MHDYSSQIPERFKPTERDEHMIVEDPVEYVDEKFIPKKGN